MSDLEISRLQQQAYRWGQRDMLTKCVELVDEMDLLCPCTANVAFWGHYDHCPKRIVRAALEVLQETQVDTPDNKLIEHINLEKP